MAQLAAARALKAQQSSNNMKTDGTVPKEGDETMNQEDLECSSDIEMIDEAPVQIQQQHRTIELSDSDEHDANEINYNDDNNARIKELERRL